MCWDVECEFVVATAEVLDEGGTGGDHGGGPEAFQSAHRPQAGLQPAMIGSETKIILTPG